MKNSDKRDLKIALGVGAAVFALVKAFANRAKRKGGSEGYRIRKGDRILYEGVKYSVEDVRTDYRDGQNLYTVCRMEPVADGTKIALKCLKILAREDELEKVSTEEQ